MRVLCTHRVPGLCDCRLQGERNIRSRQGAAVLQARAPLARGKLAAIFQMRLLQENLLVIWMPNWWVDLMSAMFNQRNLQWKFNQINIQLTQKIQFLGYRCEWCGFTSHGGCRHYVPQECTFGINQPIYLPPHAVSIPRTEVPMEAIIGVQVKTKGAPMTREYSCRKFHASAHVTILFLSIYVLLFLSNTFWFRQCFWFSKQIATQLSYVQ